MSVYKNDVPEFFKIALESISINQSLKPSQIVVVEDGPVVEEIESIFYELQSKVREIEFTLIKKAFNEGLAAALNDAIDACKYDWIARMDSDDYSTPDRFEKQFAFIEEHPGISVVGGAMCEFQKSIGDISSKRIVACNHDGIRKMMKKRNPMNHITVCYKKSDVINCGKYCISFGKLEDYKLWVDMIGAGYRFANIPEICCYARIGNGFFDRRSNKREIKDWDMLQEYLLSHSIVNRIESIRNKLYIRVFIYSPKWIKKIAYGHFLRRKEKNINDQTVL